MALLELREGAFEFVDNFAGKRTGRPVSDTWCSRIAMCKIRQVIETAEDLEKDYLVVTPSEIEQFDATIRKWEEEWVRTHAA